MQQLYRFAFCALVAFAVLASGIAIGERKALAQSETPAAYNPLQAVVGVSANIATDARTARVLGTQRTGAGIVIDGGLVLTIGYLILEATDAEVTLQDGRRVPADVIAYDYDTGFGLVRPLLELDLPAVRLGDSDGLAADTQVLVAGTQGILPAEVVSRREFAGYWEYLLPNAIFTSPPYSGFGGAALIGRDGSLLGIGSLFVGDAAGPEEASPGNMFVPINALRPILSDLLEQGRGGGPARPWLGVYAQELRGLLLVNRVAPEGPAAAAGLLQNDIILAVDDEPVQGLADFYRKIWSLGQAGTEVPLTIARQNGTVELSVKSGNRYDYLKLSQSY